MSQGNVRLPSAALFLLSGGVFRIKIMDPPRSRPMELENRFPFFSVGVHRHPRGNHEGVARLIGFGLCGVELVTGREVKSPRENSDALKRGVRVDAEFQISRKL